MKNSIDVVTNINFLLISKYFGYNSSESKDTRIRIFAGNDVNKLLFITLRK